MGGKMMRISRTYREGKSLKSSLNDTKGRLMRGTRYQISN
jgi:hypothetical protein